MTAVIFAFDRQTARSFDADGRMRVKNCILSTAEVNPYRGSEIPTWQDLNLDPDKVYDLYRDPDEMRKAADTFNGLPLMVKHIPQTAEEPRKEYQCGSIYSVEFDGKHLRGDLLVSDGRAIELIEADELSDLSCGYRYKPVMQPGEAGGAKYDGRMTGLEGNHVALVDDGRASGAHVADRALQPSPNQRPQGADAMPFPTENKDAPEAGAAPAAAPAAAPGAAAPGSPAGEANEQTNMAAIGAALKQIATLLQDIHGATMTPAAPAAAAPGAMDDMTGREDEIAQDPDVGAEDDNLELGAQGAGPPVAAEDGDLTVGQDPDQQPLPSNQEGNPARGNPTPHGAMDAKSVKALVANAVKAERDRSAAVSEAQRATRGVLGDVVMDSASAIYREALMTVGVDVSDIAKGQEKMAWQTYKTMAGRAAGVRPELAMDSKSGDANPQAAGLFAHLNKISVKG